MIWEWDNKFHASLIILNNECALFYNFWQPRGQHRSSNQQCCMIKNIKLTYDNWNINLQRNKSRSKIRMKIRFGVDGAVGYSIQPASGRLGVRIPAAKDLSR